MYSSQLIASAHSLGANDFYCSIQLAISWELMISIVAYNWPSLLRTGFSSPQHHSVVVYMALCVVVVYLHQYKVVANIF
jgi:hypothetical protein